MARNSGGTHSLPAGNPVTAGSTITAAWANNTLNDLSSEVTDSLSRSGKGGMTAPIRCADGSVSAPAFSFTSETGSGWYRSAAGVLRAAILGTYRLLLNATGLEVNGTLNASGKIIGSAGLDITGQVAVVDDGGTSKKVTVDAPTGLAADYALVLPTALPGSTLPVTLTAAGVLSTGQLVNAQQNFGTPSAATDVVIKSYLNEGSDSPTAGTNVNIAGLSVDRIGKFVTIDGPVVFGAATFAASATFLTISNGWRPKGTRRFLCDYVESGGATYGLALVTIQSSGVVQFDWIKKYDNWSGTGLLPTASGDTLYFNVCYVVP